MLQSNQESVHTFHIPVMGTGFSIDTPLKVARYGISSVISLVDDILIEQMRKFHCRLAGEPYEEITDRDEDARARRITAYLDLLGRIVERQVRALQGSPFTEGSEITRYYEMLPETPLKRMYHDMLKTDEPEKKACMQEKLRRLAVPGGIDVNIMTKLDRDVYRNGVKLPPESADAMSALRGFAKSTLNASVVCSAGFNRRLYGYMARFRDFFPGEDGESRKRIVLKVSDFRSALVQGKFLAQRGLWVSEFRIESGLNCGGHAFATNGILSGPILEEFKQKRHELIETLHGIYCKSLSTMGLPFTETPRRVKITMQGGIGTSHENDMLLRYYQVDGTGWGTPFLLVPEAVNIDEEHLEKLSAAGDGDVHLSGGSPLGVPFWNLRNSASEENRRRLISEGEPGSRCVKGFLAFDTEFTDVPICRASRAYQKRKLRALREEDFSAEQITCLRKRVLARSCICNDLAGCATLKNMIDPDAKPAVCCGPNIVNFSKVATLEELVAHIYGRISLLTNPERPHMFIQELMIYVDFFRKQAEEHSLGLSDRNVNYFGDFKQNLLKGIDYYLDAAGEVSGGEKHRFVQELMRLKSEVEQMDLQKSFESCIER